MISMFSRDVVALPSSNSQRGSPSYMSGSLAAAEGWQSPDAISAAISNLLGSGSTAYANILSTRLQYEQNQGVNIKEVLKDRDALLAKLHELGREQNGGVVAGPNWTMWAGIGAAVLLGAYLLKRK